MAKRDPSMMCDRGRDEAMLGHDELRETEDCFFDARPYASDNEGDIDTHQRTDAPARDTGGVMVIGFGVIRV